MGRFWSLLFLLVPVFGVLLFVLAPTSAYEKIGLAPEQAKAVWLPVDISEDGHLIDELFMFILYLTGAVFIATELVLFWYLWRYDAAKNPEPVKYTHGSHNLEVIWTILPAATLLFIAIYQINTWADIKMRPPGFDDAGMTMAKAPDADHIDITAVADRSPAYLAGISPGDRLVAVAGKPATDLAVDDVTELLKKNAGKSIVLQVKDYEEIITQRRVDLYLKPLAEVTGRQFEWLIRYPGPDGILNTRDDLQTVNELHVPVGEDVMLVIKSQDVLHSFFLPNLRFKQDVVPGMRQTAWFKALKPGHYDIVCAELCGWGHYKMKGTLIVESRADYEAWLVKALKEQNTTTELKPTSESDE